MKNIQKIRVFVLTSLIFFQSTPLNADIQEVINSYVQHIDTEHKVIVGCVAAIVVLWVGYYKGYIGYKVRRVERILKLDKVEATGSTGYLGKNLNIRNEAMARVFSSIKNEVYLSLENEEKKELDALIANTTVARELVRRQELALIKDITNASDIWKMETYHTSARKMLKMSDPKYSHSLIGHLSPEYEKERKEAFDKVNPQQHKFLALKTFCALSSYNLDVWKNQTTYFKDELPNIQQELVGERKK